MSRFSKYFISALVAGAFLVAPVSAFANKTGKGHAKAKAHVKVKMKSTERVERDVNRLETLLIGMKTDAMISAASWKKLSNEANMLANRIYANVKASHASDSAVEVARDLRMHVRLLHKEAHQGDAAEARHHANAALPLAYRLDEWAG